MLLDIHSQFAQVLTDYENPESVALTEQKNCNKCRCVAFEIQKIEISKILTQLTVEPVRF